MKLHFAIWPSEWTSRGPVGSIGDVPGGRGGSVAAQAGPKGGG